MLNALFRKLGRHSPVWPEEKAFLEKAPWQFVNHSHDEPIVAEGTSPSYSCLMIEGLACRYKTLPHGTRQILAFHIVGDFGDLHSFLLPRMDHGMAAVGKSTVGRLPHTVLQEITERFPRLTRSLWWDTAVDAAIHREWMVSMGRRTAYEQIAHLFCELLYRFKIVEQGQGDSFYLPATQTDLGDAFGLSAVHVNRTLQKLREAKLIVFEGKYVTLPNPERLAKIAGFDPSYLSPRADN